MKNPSQLGYYGPTTTIGRDQMDTNLVSQLIEYFKATFELSIDNAEDLFETQRNLFEYLMGLGKGYEATTMEKVVC